MLVGERRARTGSRELQEMATMTVSSLEQASMLADARTWWTVLPVTYAETRTDLEPIFYLGDLALDDLLDFMAGWARRRASNVASRNST